MKLGALDPHHREFQVNMGVFDVFRTTKILRRPGQKCHSMSRRRRRFYVTSCRIFVVREDFLSVLCSETRQWWRTFRNRCNSKPANRTSDQRQNVFKLYYCSKYADMTLEPERDNPNDIRTKLAQHVQVAHKMVALSAVFWLVSSLCLIGRRIEYSA